MTFAHILFNFFYLGLKSTGKIQFPFLLQRGHEKETTYFCSELIADIYIKFGLIKDRRKNDFWPRDFENSLKL